MPILQTHEETNYADSFQTFYDRGKGTFNLEDVVSVDRKINHINHVQPYNDEVHFVEMVPPEFSRSQNKKPQHDLYEESDCT